MKSAAKLLLFLGIGSLLAGDALMLGDLCGRNLSCGMPTRSSSMLAWSWTVLVAISLLLSSALISGRVSAWLARSARACASRLIDWLHSPGSKH